MSNILAELTKKQLLQPPTWLPENTCLLGIMGSVAYGVSSDTSDMDLYGFAIPPKDIVFPHLAGEIADFGTHKKRFHQFQKHHVQDESALAGKGREYDFTIFSIVRYFHLCMENNPNCIDSMFIPQSCILHITHIGNMVRERRRDFLHKGCWPRFKGYAYSQLHKAGNKEIIELAKAARKFEEELQIPHTTTLEQVRQHIEGEINPSLEHLNHLQLTQYEQKLTVGEGRKRFQVAKENGSETKFLYHVVRLLSEVEQILLIGDLDLQEKGRREYMKAIRRGEVPEDDIRRWASDKEKQLEESYSKSTLPERPRESVIKKLLFECLEAHYGNLSNCVTQVGWAEQALRDLDETLNRVRAKLYS